jgi:NitT/TauT family transport system ATP-binding protein
MSGLVELKNVSKNYILESGVELRVLERLNFSVEHNRVVALLGPSGCGKSTSLRIMAGLICATSGEVLVEGQPLLGINKDVAMVFQSFALFPWETVSSNVSLALNSQNLSAHEIKERVKKAIDLVGLEGFEEAYPRELSGGMKQRVGIARALVLERPLLFLDEPFSALDVLTADALRSEVVNLFIGKKTKTVSVVLVTHNIQEAVLMAQSVLVMGTNPGQIRRSIEIDLPYPRDEDSPAFRKIVSQIHAMITETLMPDILTGGKEKTPITRLRPVAVESLPKAQITEMIALLETIFDQDGMADIFELAHQSRRDFGSTLYLVKAAELFNLVDTPKQTVILTKLGRELVLGDINVRKKLLHDQFANLQIVQMTHNFIRESPKNRIHIDELTNQLAKLLPNENPLDQVQTLISWGRFSEYLGYSDISKEVYLDEGQEVV